MELSWQTVSETSNAYFEVQRQVLSATEAGRATRSGTERKAAGGSESSGAWQTLGEREGAGTTTEMQRCAFADRAVPFAAERLRYRLRQVDRDGTALLSPGVTVEVGHAASFALQGATPNPFRHAATVRYALPKSGPVRLEVFDMLGRKGRTLVDEQQPSKVAARLVRSGGAAAGCSERARHEVLSS